jgi:hypothetical protein
MKIPIVILGILLAVNWAVAQEKKPQALVPKQLVINKEELQDKIKGGWAAQTIGCTFGGPTEFRYKGTFIQDNQPILWFDGYMKQTYENIPGLYDDIYMDLTFVDVFEKEGLDAPAASHAKAYANAGYMLWHANQVGRYNILNGIMPPQSGHWLNNPQADAIDFQIEADFAGLMSPAMPVSANQICDKIGHIMNYGDGWYGGVYVANMYALAFTSKDIKYIVKESLKSIPSQSTYYQCISDVIKWHAKYPNDWKKTWFEVQRKWAETIGCPQGVFNDFNIDAKINSAYVVIGLLYGNGDFTKTLEISTRCGQDSDCNPATAGGILGTLLGYKNIPAYWKMGIEEVENLDFKYTTMSLNDVYEIGFRQALRMVEKGGGKIEGEKVIINVQTPQAVQLEQSFSGHYPIEKRKQNGKKVTDEFSFEFEGIGFVIVGEAKHKNLNDNNTPKEPFTMKAEVYINEQLTETVNLSTDFNKRRFDPFWKYQLPKQKYKVQIKFVDMPENGEFVLNDMIIYSDKPYRFSEK